MFETLVQKVIVTSQITNYIWWKKKEVIAWRVTAYSCALWTCLMNINARSHACEKYCKVEGRSLLESLSTLKERLI